MWTEIHSRRQETFTKVLGADKDKVRRNQTLENINNTDARVKINGSYIYYMYLSYRSRYLFDLYHLLCFDSLL